MRSKAEGYVRELRESINDKEQRSRQPTVLVRTTERRPLLLWRLIVGPGASSRRSGYAGNRCLGA